MTWAVLSNDKLNDMAARYEAACIMALKSALNGTVNREAGVSKFMEMRRGIRLGLCGELRDLGCPASEIADTAAAIVNYAVRARLVAGMPVAGNA